MDVAKAQASVRDLWKSAKRAQQRLTLCYRRPMGFSAGTAVRVGWEAFKQRPWFFVGVAFVILLASLLIDALTSTVDALFTGSAKDPSAAGFVINIGLGTLLSMGVTAFYLAAYDNPAAADLALLWHPQPFWKYLGVSVLLTLVVLLGLVLLIVPGIIFGLMYMFAPSSSSSGGSVRSRPWARATASRAGISGRCSASCCC